MKRTLVASLATLAFLGAGCGEQFTTISNDPKQVLVVDEDGHVDDRNLYIQACGISHSVKAVTYTGNDTYKAEAAVVTCGASK